MLPWEKHTVHANQFCMVSEGTGQINYTCNSLLSWEEKMCIFGRELGWLPKGIAQFLGRETDYFPKLRNFWAE